MKTKKRNIKNPPKKIFEEPKNLYLKNFWMIEQMIKTKELEKFQMGFFWEIFLDPDLKNINLIIRFSSVLVKYHPKKEFLPLRISQIIFPALLVPMISEYSPSI